MQNLFFKLGPPLVLNPVHCPFFKISNCNREMLNLGQFLSTINVYVPALAAYYRIIDSNSLWAHKLILTFLKGARSFNFQKFPKHGFSLFVQNSLETPPKKPMQDAKLKRMSLKVSFLLQTIQKKKNGIKETSFCTSVFHMSLGDLVTKPRCLTQSCTCDYGTPNHTYMWTLPKLSHDLTNSFEADQANPHSLIPKLCHFLLTQ